MPDVQFNHTHYSPNHSSLPCSMKASNALDVVVSSSSKSQGANVEGYVLVWGAEMKTMLYQKRRVR